MEQTMTDKEFDGRVFFAPTKDVQIGDAEAIVLARLRYFELRWYERDLLGVDHYYVFYLDKATKLPYKHPEQATLTAEQVRYALAHDYLVQFSEAIGNSFKEKTGDLALKS